MNTYNKVSVSLPSNLTAFSTVNHAKYVWLHVAVIYEYLIVNNREYSNTTIHDYFSAITVTLTQFTV